MHQEATSCTWEAAHTPFTCFSWRNIWIN